MSIMDKIKSMFSGGSSSADSHDDAGHDHSGHDHAGHDHSDGPVAPAMPPADPAGMPTSEPTTGGDGENRPS